MSTPLERLVRLVRKPVDLETLCNRLNLSPRATLHLAAQARKKGHAVEILGGEIALRPASPGVDITEVRIAPTGSEHVFAVATDLHFGSKYHLRAQFLDFIDRSYKVGARVIFLPGDLLDGCYRHGRWELTHHGFQDQAEDFVKSLPQKPGLSYYAITGNHDQTFEDSSGIVVHTALQDMFRAAGRRDVHMLGARGATVCLRAPRERRGLVVTMWHPLKGPAYALTYKMQKWIEGCSVGQKPDVLLVGHWHQSCYFNQRGIHAMSCGTFQGGGSAFGKALGGAPSIGGWTVHYALTTDGTVRDFSPAWSGYFEKEEPRLAVI
jgi:predicted phosphodiesterase